MSINQHLKNILTTGTDSDFSIFAFNDTGSKIEKKVHKLVIRQSPYFSAMFDLNSSEVQNGSVTFENITEGTLDVIIKYMYTGECVIASIEEALTVGAAAEYLQLADLRDLAIKKWQQLYSNITDDHHVISAFRKLFWKASSLNLTFHFDDWHPYVETVFAAIAGSTESIAEDSRAFVKFLLEFHGQKHPLQCLELLTEWASVPEQKEHFEELVKEISLVNCSLRTLASISKTTPFPPACILDIIQKRSETPEVPREDTLTYEIKMKKNHLVELEHYLGFVIIQFKCFNHPHRDAYVVLSQTSDLDVEVLCRSVKDQRKSKWSKTITRGSFSEKIPFDDRLDETKAITFQVTLTPSDGTSTKSNTLTMVLD